MRPAGHGGERNGVELVVVARGLLPARQLGAAGGGRARRGHPLFRHPHLQPRQERAQTQDAAEAITRGQCAQYEFERKQQPL